MNKWLEDGARAFKGMMRAGNLDGIVVYDLIESYKFQEDDWELKDALRKVIKYYLSAEDYKIFKREVGIDEG